MDVSSAATTADASAAAAAASYAYAVEQYQNYLASLLAAGYDAAEAEQYAAAAWYQYHQQHQAELAQLQQQQQQQQQAAYGYAYPAAAASVQSHAPTGYNAELAAYAEWAESKAIPYKLSCTSHRMFRAAPAAEAGPPSQPGPLSLASRPASLVSGTAFISAVSLIAQTCRVDSLQARLLLHHRDSQV
jgi:hypothetical protein